MSAIKDMAGDIFGQLATDKKKQEGGTWITPGSGWKVKVAEFANPAFKSYWEAITVPFRRQIENKTISDAELEELMIDAMAETILVDWDGIVVDGKKFPYSKKNAVRLMTELPKFRDIVAEESRRFENFRAAAMEADKGN